MRVLILLDERGRKHAVPVDEPMARVAELGTVKTEKLRASIGRRIEIGGRRFIVLEPSARDWRESMARGPQTLASKDLAAILYETGVVAGARVLEAGAGSGGLTVALARAVGPQGHVISIDLEEAAIQLARSNAMAAGVESNIEFRIGDVRQGVADRDLDAVILDIVDPWMAVSSAWEALRPSGSLATFSPNMEQVKETVAAMRGRPFVDVRTIELIEREMEVRDVGVRPSFAPLGHTGYLTFARKVLDTF
ncbi:MAG TPA: methyltransferase domain-containing protein [Thermoplasmata archaeon]|nr:methyltransferase domain-containing protein [Thermoplasmata archaeon]